MEARTEAARIAAEQEFHYELLPGTELMADVAGPHQVHAHNDTNAIVLVPQPTRHLHDPLVITPYSLLYMGICTNSCVSRTGANYGR
jgi:hypothetical protein